jgi:hypothetical protein
MALIQLAYPYEGHAPDEVVDVDDITARDMVRDGMARWPDVEGRTVAELKAMAEQQGVDLAGATRKEEIAKALERAAATPTGASAGSTEGVTDGNR